MDGGGGGGVVAVVDGVCHHVGAVVRGCGCVEDDGGVVAGDTVAGLGDGGDGEGVVVRVGVVSEDANGCLWVALGYRDGVVVCDGRVVDASDGDVDGCGRGVIVWVDDRVCERVCAVI